MARVNAKTINTVRHVYLTAMIVLLMRRTHRLFQPCHCQRTYSYCQTKTPCHFLTQSIKITSHVVHCQSEKQKSSVYFSARGKLYCGCFFIWTIVYPACPLITPILYHGTSCWYVEPGQVVIPVVQVVVVWALSIVVTSRLIETTLFMRKHLCKLQHFFDKFSKPDTGLQFGLGF